MKHIEFIKNVKITGPYYGVMLAGVNTWLINYLLFIYILASIFMYLIQYCFICRPSDSILSEDAEIEPKGRILKRNTAQKAQLDLGLPWGSDNRSYCSNIELAVLTWALLSVPITKRNTKYVIVLEWRRWLGSEWRGVCDPDNSISEEPPDSAHCIIDMEIPSFERGAPTLPRVHGILLSIPHIMILISQDRFQLLSSIVYSTFST